MISIKRFLEQRQNGGRQSDELLEAALQMARLLLEAIATHVVHGRDADWKSFVRIMKGLLRRTDEPPSPLHLLEIASEAVEALESNAQRTTSYLREQNDHMQSMLVMLTDTLADISGQSEVSLASLQAIEQQIEQAAGLEDIGALRNSLESCLSALRHAAAQHRKDSTATAQRLREHISSAQNRLPPERTRPGVSHEDIDLEPETFAQNTVAATTSYVAAFKLQRADHIATRFGEGTKLQMLALISQSLKTALGPDDRLLRWKGTSFVMFLKSAAPLAEIRRHLSEAVAMSGQHYIEVGKRSALLSVGVDWVVFAQAQCPSLDAVFAEVDAFLAGESRGEPQPAEDKV